MPHEEWPARPPLALLTDLYALTMMQAYVEDGMEEEAVFDLFVRRLPERRNYLLCCGLDEALTFCERVAFDQRALQYLEATRMFSQKFLQYLQTFRFTGDVSAVLEGTPVFGSEPLLEISAPLPQAQLLEALLLNQIGLQTLLASKAARVVAAARGRAVVDFGLRRTQGIDAGMKAARAFYVAGLAATSNVAAGQLYGIPIAGTMAHSYIQAHDDEAEAFRRFATIYPETTLLVDTYDSLRGVRHVVDLARALGPDFRVRAIRLDSGDLGDLARRARAILDEAGLQSVRIFASGGLAEEKIAALVDAGAPIDAFGVGTEMGVSSDAPTLDIVYKLVSYAGVDRLKLSPGKRLLPGRKQVFRKEEDGRAALDVIGCSDERGHGRPLLTDVMRGGMRLPVSVERLDAVRARAAAETARLPERLRALRPAEPAYAVEISPALKARYDRAVRSRHVTD